MKLKEKYNTWSFKKKIFAAVIAVILILLILMCIVDIGILLINGSFVIGTDGDWISFWGSAIGSLLGIIGAVGVSYWSTRKQLIESKKNDFENQIKLADLSRLSEALTILKKCDDGLSKLKKDVKRHDFNISQKKLDDMYDDDTPINHLKWIGEDGEKTGVLVDNFLIQFKSVTKSLGQSESEILEFRIKKLEDQYSIVKEQWRRKMADYSEIVNVSESFVELKRVFDLLNEETLKCYINIRKIAKD